MATKTLQHPSGLQPEGSLHSEEASRITSWETDLTRQRPVRSTGKLHARRLRTRVSHRQILDTGTSVSSDSDDVGDSEDDPVERFLDRLFDSPTSVFQSTKAGITLEIRN